MSIETALTQIEVFRGKLLADTVAAVESGLSGSPATAVGSVLSRHGITHDLLMAAGAVKRASAQIDVIIHLVGAALALPYILHPGEVIESNSLGAGTAASDFDLVTDRRIAEFKFIHWQGGAESVRKKTLFQDFYKLAREETPKEKYLYLLNTAIPLRFLRGRSGVRKIFDRNRRLCDDYVARYGDAYTTVGQFYTAFRHEVQLVNLVKVMPEFKVFLDLWAE